MNFAIIGASGNVGRKTIEILEKSKIGFDNLFLVASPKSAGKKIKFRNQEIKIENLEDYDFSKVASPLNIPQAHLLYVIEETNLKVNRATLRKISRKMSLQIMR